MYLGFAMPKLVGFSWLCCPPGTTLLESGPPHWLAMAPGRTVLPSTSLVQVRQTCSPICPAALCLPSDHPITLLRCFQRRSFHSNLSIPSLSPPEEEDAGGLRILLTVTPVGFMLLTVLAALGFFYNKRR